MKRFEITYFYGPSPDYIVKEECIADIAASGVTLCQLDYKCDVEAKKKALPLLKKYGLSATIMEPQIADLCKKRKIEKVDAVVKKVVEDYAMFDNVVGWDIFDEPDSEEFPILAEIVKAFRRYSPDKEVVINLYPNYVRPEILKSDSYLDHLENFVKIVKPDFLSYDHYPFLGRNKNNALKTIDSVENEKERLIQMAANKEEDRDNFFENLEDVRRVGLEKQLEQMLIILLTEHGKYRNLSRGEIRWEVNMCLAYGMHRISYFTYWLPTEGNEAWQWDNAMCDREGNKFEHYYDVQAINKEISTIGEMLFETTSEAVFHVGTHEKGTIEFEGYGHITEIKGDNAVIGFFENGYVYLVNHDYKKENTFTICSDKAFSIYEKESFVSCGNTYTQTLSAGEGLLMRWD